MTRVGRTRPMRPGDVPQVGALFFSAFRQRRPERTEHFEQHLHDLFFTHPCYEPSLGGAVYESADGRIDAAFTAIPMRFGVQGQPIVARLVCTFMASPNHGPNFLGAAELALGLRPRRQDLCFTDSASPVTADHFRAVGGSILPVHALEWFKVFKPAAFLGDVASGRYGRKVGLPLDLLAKPADALWGRLRGRRTVSEDECRIEDASSERFAAAMDELLAGYAVRPLWSASELDWICAMASGGRPADVLNLRIVVDRDQRPCGAFVFSGRPGKDAIVLNIMARKGRERVVVSLILQHLRHLNYASARGRADPRILDALSSQKWVFFRHGSHVCISSRHADISNAIASNDIFIGGLAGEGWSRLTRDFF